MSSASTEAGSIAMAREVGHGLAALCADKAERTESFDTDGAARAAVGLLARHGPMSGEAITDALKGLGFRPHKDRAFGAVYRMLSLRRKIVCAGWCARLKGHGTAGGRVWRLSTSAEENVRHEQQP
jgi:hypothetical protein